ncbi:MAG: hypothetical protein WD358_07485 [Nitriliruptoraceae bacterium]
MTRSSQTAWISASDLLRESAANVLEIDEPVAGLLPQGGLYRGEAIAVTGSTSLMLSMLARPSRQRCWCVVVGLPGLGLAAAREAGVDLERLVLIPHPGERWAQIVATLLDAFDVVVACPSSPVTASTARKLTAVARRQSTVLVVHHPGGIVAGGNKSSAHRHADHHFQGVRWHLRVVAQQWEGLQDGSGYLQARRLKIELVGKSGGVRHTTTVWLPGNIGHVDPTVGQATMAAASPSLAVTDTSLVSTGLDGAATQRKVS